jgi:hypothetical protein
MATKTILQWKMLLGEAAVWTAADYLLRDLLNFSMQCGAEDGTLDKDRHQVENFLTAWRSVSVARTSTKTHGPIPILDGSMSVGDWKILLSRLTASSAAEVIVGNYLYDPRADYTYCVQALTRALIAWGELETANHKATVLPLPKRG